MSSEPPKPGSNKKKQASKKGAAAKTGENVPVSLVRDDAPSMNPRGILTGLYGSRGERMRHTVHDGALRMPREALDLIEEVTKETGVSVSDTYELPGLDHVVRPSLDPTLDKIVVTELSAERVAVPQAPPPQGPDDMAVEPAKSTVVNMIRTRAENRTIDRTVAKADTTERIRGGGSDGTTNATESQPASAISEANPVPPAPAPSDPTPVAVAAPEVAAITAPSLPPMAAAAPTSVTQPDAQMSTIPAVAAPIASVGTAATQQPGPTSTVVPAPIASVGTPATQQPGPTSTAAVPSSTIPAAAAPMPPSTSSSVAIAATPAAVTSSVTSTAPIKKEALPQIETLPTKPAPQWEQHKPGPNDETVTPADQLTPKPSWYAKGQVADIERTMLPEWFDTSAPHRTPASYVEVRNKIISIAEQLANRNLTSSLIRRSVVGDAGSLHRLRAFLINWGIINEDGINDSAPTPASLREEVSGVKRFSDQLRDELIHAVVRQSKRQKVEMTEESIFVPIDWKEIASQVGHGASSTDCEREFLKMPLQESDTTTVERSITPDASHETKQSTVASGDMGISGETIEELRRKIFLELVDESHPEVISAVTAAALQATDNNLQKAQKAALAGLAASRAVEHARSQEDAVALALSELVSQRMQKLENRLALMDDIEGILEAERVTLELERRDLYTARCRHWFGAS